MPATFATMGVDGDGDGHAVIDNPADSIFSAANYLTHSGVHDGPTGVRAALFAYNRATWYVNDVLFYAHAYGGGPVSGSGADPCAPVPAGTALAMVTYNIHYGRDPGAVASEIASVTARAPGGVVCLQEATVAHRVRLPHGWHLIQPRVPGPNGGRIPSATPLLVDTTRWSVTGTDVVELTGYTRVGAAGAGPATASRRDLVLAGLTGPDPGARAGVVRGGRAGLPAAVDAAGRHRHGRDRARAGHRGVQRRGARAHAVHAGHLRHDGCRW
jgi:hypothetical protein